MNRDVTNPRKMSLRQKQAALLEARGISEDELGRWLREKGFSSEHLERFEKEILSALASAERPDRAMELENRELKKDLDRKNKTIAEMSALLVLKKKLFDAPERIDLKKMTTRKWILELVAEAQAAGARLDEICKTAEINPRTLKRWRADLRDDGRKNNRFQVFNMLAPEERKVIRSELYSERFCDLSPNVIVSILAEEGKYYASERTMYRILNKDDVYKARSTKKAPKRSKPWEFKASGPNQIWSWDITYILTKVKGKFFFVYLMVDVWDRVIVGWAVHAEQSGALAALLLEDACKKHGIEPHQLVLHQDNGSPMTSSDFLAKMKELKVLESFSRPGVCDDNPFSESLFKTVKYRPGFPLRFESLEELQEWMTEFVEWYNNEHRHSGIGFVTPMQRRNGEDIKILEKRRETYEAARRAHPERWSRNTRKWGREDTVVLNPQESKKEKKKSREESAA